MQTGRKTNKNGSLVSCRTAVGVEGAGAGAGAGAVHSILQTFGDQWNDCGIQSGIIGNLHFKSVLYTTLSPLASVAWQTMAALPFS